MKVIGAVVGVIALVVLLGFICSYPIMLLWNGCLVPAVDGVHEVTWLQAWGLTILFGFLFKSSVSNSSK